MVCYLNYRGMFMLAITATPDGQSVVIQDQAIKFNDFIAN